MMRDPKDLDMDLGHLETQNTAGMMYRERIILMLVVGLISHTELQSFLG